MPSIVDRETQRLAALARYQVMDTAREPAFDEIAALVAAICEAPVAIVNFVAGDRQFFKAEVGIGVDTVPLELSFCAHALLENDFLLVPDTTQDARFAGNPLVTGEPHVRFYAGALLKTADGLPIGTLCVLDTRTRTLTEVQENTLRVLARQVMTQLDQRLALQTIALSEARQRAIVDSAADVAIIATDLAGIIIEWSYGAENVLGWDEAEAVGRDAGMFFTTEDRTAGVPEREQRCAREEGRAADERWHVRRSGERFWASGEMSPLADHTGRQVGYVKVLRDRTEQHLAGKALEEAERSLRWAQEAGGIGVFHLGLDGILHTTPQLCRLYGVEECSTTTPGVFEQLVVAEDRHLVSNDRSRATGTASLDVEYRIRRADTGEVRWIARKGEIERDEYGAPLRFAGTARDVTDERTARDALARSEALARANVERVQLALSAGAIIGTWVWDLRSDRFTVDDALATAFEIDPVVQREAFSPQQVLATVHPDDQPGLVDAIATVIARGGSYVHRYRVRRNDGSYRWIEANGRVDHAPDGTPLRFPGVLLDVEEKRVLEQERDEATAALIVLNETLEQRVAERTTELMQVEEALRQAQKMEAVGQLTGGIAHDFNNMLTGVIGNLDLIQRHVASGNMERVARYIDAASTSAQRAAGLTARLLAFGRRQSLDLQPIAMNALVDGMEDLLHRTLSEQVVLETHLANDLWAAATDANQLESALLNLCINARDAMPGGGKLVIETNNTHLDERYARDHPGLAPGDYVSLSVSDTGTGMAASTIERVFEPFFTTKPVGQGTGLGLSMIYGFARQSRGHVAIYSELGRGTTVKLYVPRHDGVVAVAVPMTVEAPLGAGETVMVVEDDPSVRLIVLEVLEDLGYDAIEAVDATTAVPILQSDRRIDLLVTDVGLPGMNGRQLAEVARQTRLDLKILFITGYAQNAAVRNGFLDAGMEMMTKPFAVEALATRVREILTRQP